MPIVINESSASLQGVCTVEDAEPLLQWLLANPGGEVRLGDCLSLHCSILQTLLAANAQPVGTAADPELAAWIEAAARLPEATRTIESVRKSAK